MAEMTAMVTARWCFIGHTTRFVMRTWPWRDANVTMAATATVVVGVFLDLRKRRSEQWRPRTRNLEWGGILTLKGSNRHLGQEFSGIMMTRRKIEAIATTHLNAYVSEELNRPEIYNEKEVCNKLDTIMKKGKFCVWPIHRVFAVPVNVTVTVVVVFAVVWPGPYSHHDSKCHGDVHVTLGSRWRSRYEMWSVTDKTWHRRHFRRSVTPA